MQDPKKIDRETRIILARIPSLRKANEKVIT